MPLSNTPDINPLLVPARTVRARYGDVDESTIYRWTQNGVGFPKPVKIGRGRGHRNFWVVSELDAFDAAQLAKREAA